MEPPPQFKTIINSSDSLTPFPPHRRRHLKSDTFSTFLRILSHCPSPSPHPHPGSDNNGLARTTEIRTDENGTTGTGAELLSFSGDVLCAKDVNVAGFLNDNGMKANEFDLGDKINKELVMEKGRPTKELEQTTKACCDANGTTNIALESLSTIGPSCLKMTNVVESVHEDRMETPNLEFETLSSNGDASCSKVSNVTESVHEDRVETRNMKSEILPTKVNASCSKVTNVPESVHEDGKEATNMDSEILSSNCDASCSKVTIVAESIHEGRMDATNMKSEILPTNGVASCLKLTNVAESVHEDKTETTNMESEILSTNGDASCSKIINVTESVHDDKMETDDFDCGNWIINKELCQETGSEIENFLGETNPGSSVVSLTTIDELQNSQIGSLLENSEIVTHTDTDKEDQSCKMTESFHFSPDMDEPVKSPILGGNEEVINSVLESSDLHQVDLENSLTNCGLMNSPLCVAGDEEVEEGEISGDFVIDDELIDFLFEEEQNSEPIISREGINNQNQKGTSEVVNKYDEDSGVTVDKVGKGVESNLRESDVSAMESKYGKMIGEIVSNQKQADSDNEEFNHSVVPGKVLAERARTNQGDLSIDMDAGAQKKRKRGPMTQEKRAKRKKKERIKRAEKNRQLGVKRLKILPVVKPKKIEICRHYLKGRCQEGDKCKFSHDTTPLTKSKPCCHFARNSCMKGDVCPYDHQLSKYPCNNFLTNGFCSRGTDCLFSHEVQRAEGSHGTANASSSEVKESSLSWVTNPEKKMISGNSSNQKVDFKSDTSAISSSLSAQQKIAEMKLRTAAPSPRGISKLLFGKSSLGNESKLIQAGTSSKADGNVNVNLSVINSTQNMVSNLIGTSKVAGHVEQKGLSFLSFGKAPAHDIHMDKDKQAASPSKQAERLKFTNHAGESKRDLVPNSSETPKRSPSIPPRGINFLSFGKSSRNNSGNMMIATPNADNSASSPAHERERVSNLRDLLCKGTSSSGLKALLSNGPSSAQKALQSTLAFAAKYESRVKIDHPGS